MIVTKLEEMDGNDRAFEISGLIDRITVHCSSSQDLHEWLDHLQRLTRGVASGSGTLSKTHSWSAHSRMSYILKDSSKSPMTMKKFLPKRKTERKASEEEFVIRKSTVVLEEDAQILKVIEAYCTGASFQQTLNS
ncbi:hypothetical protein lerEdw1_004002, partial [Lerista edwardsae]